MKHVFSTFVLICLGILSQGCASTTPSEPDHIKLAEEQLRFMVQQVDNACLNAENQEKKKFFPYSLRTDSTLAMAGARDWRSGFFAGNLWMMYQNTGDKYWLEQAERYTWPLEELKDYTGSHDLGFMVYNSFGKGYELTGEERYRDIIVQTAKSLATRYNPNVGCIRSWDFNRDRWDYPVIIDNMMNLELMFRATQLSGDSIYWNIAVSHADNTLKNHFREDASSYHVIDYNPETGEVQKRNTFQGFSDDSYWMRGQAWGLYGFTMCYRFTHDDKYLKHAQRIADFWLSLKHMPEDAIPYWDMKLPTYDETTPRDASAAAVTASGLYELANYVQEDKAENYRSQADKILESLSSLAYLSALGTNQGFLLMHSTGHLPNQADVDVPLIYADYYYLEALLRRKNR